jgi:uroporphyrinogen decarboxylase
MLSAHAFMEFSCRYLTRIVAGLRREHDGARIPCVLFTKGGGQWLDSMAETGCDALGLDWTLDIGEARRKVGDRVALQGNLDPAVLFAPPAVVAAQARAVLDDFGSPMRHDGRQGGHVFNLGHGISQHTPPEHVHALVEAVHAHSRHVLRQASPA